MAQTRGVFHGEVTITVLVPAHNEAERITGTIQALQAQHGAPERIIVVADNCTDETPELARASGVEVFETRGNRHKKVGGLNQALRELLPGQGENDIVMVVDADTALDQGFLAEARRRFTDDRALMAVGGLFSGGARGRLAGPVPAQRVHPLQPGHPPSPRARLRAHRHRVGLPATGAAGHRGVPGHPAAGTPRRRLRHGGADGGQRTDACAEIARWADDLTRRVLGGHRGDAHLAAAVAPASPLAARGAGEPRRLRGDAADHAVLVPAAGDRLRRRRSRGLLRPDHHHDTRPRRMGLVPVLDAAGAGLHGGACGDGVAIHAVREVRRRPAGPGTALRKGGR